MLKSNVALRVLNVERNRIGPHGGVALGGALEGGCALTRLGLAENKLGNKGVAAMVAAVKGQTKLVSLSLDGNGLKDLVGDLNTTHPSTIQGARISVLKRSPVPVAYGTTTHPFRNVSDTPAEITVKVRSSRYYPSLGLTVESAINKNAFPVIRSIAGGSPAFSETKISIGLSIRSVNGVRMRGASAEVVTSRIDEAWPRPCILKLIEQ